MKPEKPKVHFTDKYLLQPTNPVMVNLIGAGGTGSQLLTALGRINLSLNALQHPGIFVRVFDDDIITAANKGRQLFADSEIGLPKAAALINRVNRFFGTDWKAYTMPFNRSTITNLNEYRAHITISCVDKVQARFDIAAVLQKMAKSNNHKRDRIRYWMDFGNSRFTGQVLLATIGKIEQPPSKNFETVDSLPLPTVEFKDLFVAAKEDKAPSCSLAEALTQQDLFINSSLANLGGSLLWNLFSQGMIECRGFFMNLKNFRTTPLSL